MNLADNIQFKHSVLSSANLQEVKGLIDGGKSLTNAELNLVVEKRAAMVIEQEFPIFVKGLDFVVTPSDYKSNLVNPFLLWAYIVKNDSYMFLLDDVIDPKITHPVFYLNNNYSSLFKVNYVGNGEMNIQSNILGIGMEGPYTVAKNPGEEEGKIHLEAHLKDANDMITWTFTGFPLKKVSKELISYWIKNKESLKPSPDVRFTTWSWIFFTIYCYFRFHNYPMSFNTMSIISGSFDPSDSHSINNAEKHIEWARKAFKYFTQTKRTSESLRDVSSFYQFFNINNGEGIHKYYKMVKEIQEIQLNPKYSLLKREWINGYGKGIAPTYLIDDYYETFVKLYWKTFTEESDGESEGEI